MRTEFDPPSDVRLGAYASIFDFDTVIAEEGFVLIGRESVVDTSPIVPACRAF
jgi:hypothetical protein